MRIRHKIFAGYLVTITLSIALAGVSFVAITNINRSYGDLINRDQKVLLQTYNLRSSVQREIVAARTYEQLGDPGLYTEFENAIQDQEKAIQEIKRLLVEPEDVQALQSIETTSSNYTQVAQQAIQLALSGQQPQLLTFRRNEGEPARMAFINSCDRFIDKKGNQVAAKQANLEMQVNEASARLLLGTVIGVMATLLAAMLLTQGLTLPLRRLMRSVQGISSGDLQTAIVVKSHDEIGELANVLEAMRQKLAQAQHGLETANAELARTLATESEARMRIEEISRLKDEFAGMVSHELKTPVSYVYNYATALKEHNNSLNEGQRHEFLTSIQSEAMHVLTLVDDIMAISLLEAGSLKHRFVETDLRQITDSAVKDQQITTRRHTLTVKGPESVPIWADPTRLKQVLNNLLSNAIKYSPQGGNIEVRLRTNPGDGTALIYVRDYGIGILPSDVPKLFDRFTRIERKETMTIPGSGLGLYIAHHIIKAHRGSLSLEPAPGKGTIACAILPLLRGAFVSTEAAKKLSAVGYQPRAFGP